MKNRIKFFKSNFWFILFIILMIVPKTRLQIQIGINKVFTLISPRVISEKKQVILTDNNWQLQNIVTGEGLNFNELKGKVIFINFWATWCGPCISELTDLHNLKEDYGGKVVFLFVTQENKKVVDSFLAERELKLPIYKSLSTYPKELDHSGIPKTYIIDKNSKITVDKTGVANWNGEKIRSLLDQLLAE